MSLRSSLAFLAVALVSVPTWAEDDAETTSEEKPAETTEAADKAKDAKKKDGIKATFTTLPLCRHCEGSVEIQVPGGDWAAAEEGKFYPLGSSYRTKAGGSLVLAFGRDSSVKIEGVASFGTRAEAIGVKSRTVILQAGRLSVEMPDNLPDKAFFLTTPSFTVSDLSGQSQYDYEDKGDGELVKVRCITGSLSVSGRHFTIPQMRAANEVEIRNSRDNLFTSLVGKSGDYVVHLDQGERIKEELGDDGKMKTSIEKRTSDWKLSPSTKIAIHRAVPAIGKRMSVFMMCFDTAGNVKSQCCYCEGRAEINSGEMIKKEKSNEELAKRAAEASKTSEAAASTTEESPAEEEKKEEKKAEKESESEDGEL